MQGKLFKARLDRIDENGQVSEQAFVEITTLAAPPSIKAPAYEEARKIKNPTDAMNALCRALARWVEEDGVGRELWKDTANDMNIADIRGYEKDPCLMRHLVMNGIDTLKITLDDGFEITEDFTYDTILPKRDKNFKDPTPPHEW